MVEAIVVEQPMGPLNETRPGGTSKVTDDGGKFRALGPSCSFGFQAFCVTAQVPRAVSRQRCGRTASPPYAEKHLYQLSPTRTMC